MNNQQFDKLVQSLQDVMRCPNCSSAYSLEDINYLGQMDTMTFLHLKCSKCNTPVFASIATANHDGDLIQPELVEEQIIKRRNLNSSEDAMLHKITHDDVLNVHEALFKSNGDLAKFLRSN